MKQKFSIFCAILKQKPFLIALTLIAIFGHLGLSQGIGCKALEFKVIPQSGDCCYKLLANNSTPDNCFQQVTLNVSPDVFLNFTGLSGWRTNQVSASEYNIRPAVGYIPLGLSEIASFCIEGGPASQLLFQWENLCLLESCDSLMNITGCLPKGNIDGYVYVDIGCQGKPYLKQPGLEDWTVEVYDVNFDLVSTAQTDITGYYSIFDLPIGSYTVSAGPRKMWTPKIPASGKYIILVEEDRTKRANFGMCYPACSCDSLNINLDQVDEVYNDTTIYYLNILNKESYCFNEIEITVDSGKIVLTEVLVQNWNVQLLSENKILLLPPNGLVPVKHTIPLLMYVIGNDLLNISIETRNVNGNDVLKCKHQYQFNKPPTKPRPNCCPSNAATPGPNVTIDPNFNLNTPQFTWSPGLYTYTNTNFGPGNIYIGTGSLATTLNPGFFPYSGKSGHPGDKYLIVDASTISTGYIWKQTQLLNPGELYTFCAYFKNLLFPGPNPSNASNPQLQLRVYKSGLKAQSTVLTLKEGDPWTQLTLSFIAAGGGVYDFEIWSLNQITNGNDFGLDCVTIQSCIPEEKCCVSKDSFCDRLMKYISYVVDEPNCKLTLNIGNIPPCDSIMVQNWGDNQASGIYYGANSTIMHTYSGASVYFIKYLAIEWDYTVDPPRICNEKVITDTIVMTCGRCACPSPAFYSLNLTIDGDFSSNSTSWFNNTLLTFTNVYSGSGSNEYTIASNTQAFDPGLPSCTDHTPGNNMLIASFNTALTDLVEHTVNVVPNTTYFIEYFIMTPSNSLFTTGVLEVDNGYSVIGQSALLNGNCHWYKICFRWFSGSKTKLHFIIGATNNIIPVGSDVKIALDDISVRSCGFINTPCICPSSPIFLDLNVAGKTTVLTSLPHGVQTPVIQCTNSPLIISGYYGCVNSDTSGICPETIVGYEVIGPNNTTILGGFTTNYTSIFIPGTLVNNPGTYKIKLATICPGAKDSCIHYFDWIINCNTDTCTCESLKIDVAYGFNVSGNKNSCKRTFKPNQLCSTDMVTWHIIGAGNTNVMLKGFNGKTPFQHTFNQGGTYTVCMIVKRTDAIGNICMETKCRKIFVHCPPFPLPWTGFNCTSNIIENGDFEDGIEGSFILENGTSLEPVSKWSLFPNTGNGVVIADTFTGAFDTRGMTMIANMNNFAGIVCWGAPIITSRSNINKIAFQYYNHSTAMLNSNIEFRLQTSNKLKSISDYILLKYYIKEAEINSWISVDLNILIDTNKITPEYKYLVICLQNENESDYSVVTIDNVEICDEKDVRVGTNWVKDKDKNIFIFPNPTTSELNIEWKSDQAQIDRMNIIDITGRKVWTKPIDKNVNSTQINLTSIPSGMYFVELISKDRLISTKKLIKN